MRPHEGKRGKNMKTDLRRAGVLNLEMEAATVFTISGSTGSAPARSSRWWPIA